MTTDTVIATRGLTLGKGYLPPLSFAILMLAQLRYADNVQ